MARLKLQSAAILNCNDGIKWKGFYLVFLMGKDSNDIVLDFYLVLLMGKDSNDVVLVTLNEPKLSNLIYQK